MSGPSDLELAASYVDDTRVIDGPTSGFEVLNRQPEPDQGGVDPTQPITFDIMSFTAGGGFNTSVPTVEVQINGVRALWADRLFHAPVVNPAFAGPTTGFVLGDSWRYHVTIDPVLPFTSPETDGLPPHTVRVDMIFTPTNGDDPQTITWFFQLAETVPADMSAEARGRRLVRATFDAPAFPASMIGVERLNGDGPTFTVSGASPDGVRPVFTPQVRSFTVLDVQTVECTLSQPMTAGGAYTLAISGWDDQNGLALIPPYSTGSFSGYLTPTRPESRVFQLLNMLAEIDRTDDTSLDQARFIYCLQEVVDTILDDMDALTSIFDPDAAAEEWLDRMLVDLGNPFNFTLSEIDKRRLLRVLVAMYKQKGTPQGVINTIRFFMGLEVTIDAWWITAGLLGDMELGVDFELAPEGAGIYTFDVLAGVVLTDEQIERMTAIVTYMKPAHTHLHEIVTTADDLPETPDHVELGLSELGPEFLLH